MKPLAIAFSRVDRGLKWGDGGGDLTNVQCETIQNYHNECPLYHEYTLIKMKRKRYMMSSI
jgi:hypothetical protein